MHAVGSQASVRSVKVSYGADCRRIDGVGNRGN